MQKDDIIKEAVTILREYLGDDYKIFLFGSWAKGDALETSDIDIGILGAREVPWDIMVGILQKIRAIPTLRKVDIVDFYTKEKSFRENALRYAQNL